MAIDKTITVFLGTAWSGHWEVFSRVGMESIPSFGDSNLGELVSLDWHTTKSPETLESRSSLDTIVVLGYL